jgi:hypothetical protein
LKTIFLRFKQSARADISERHIKDCIEWVDSLDDASADDMLAIERIQMRLKRELGLETKLTAKTSNRTQRTWAIRIQK